MPLDWLQWPAMADTVLAAYLVASKRPLRRYFGFWCFLLSNLLWVLWGWPAQAWGLVALQAGLVPMNLRGLWSHRRSRRAVMQAATDD